MKQSELDDYQANEYRCEYCDFTAATEKGVFSHEGQSHPEELPWRDEELLRELYIEKGLPYSKVGEILGCGRTTVRYWLKKHGIEIRPSKADQKFASFYNDTRGYEEWIVRVDGTIHHVRVHRLLAVAEWGADAVADKVVHHKNEIPWDNRVTNLQLMGRSEHAIHHSDIDITPKDVLRIKRLCDEGVAEQQEIAERFGIAQPTVSRISRGKGPYDDL